MGFDASSGTHTRGMAIAPLSLSSQRDSVFTLAALWTSRSIQTATRIRQFDRQSPPSRPGDLDHLGPSPRLTGQEDSDLAPRAARLSPRARERDPPRTARSCFTLHLRSQSLIKRSNPG